MTTKETNPTVQALLDRIKARQPQLQKVELRSLGTVYLRRPTGADQLKIAHLKQELNAQNLKILPTSVFASVMGCVLLLQEDGTPVFDDPEAGFQALQSMDGEDLLELNEKLMEICAPSLTAKAVEEAEKKSSSDQKSDSGTS